MIKLSSGAWINPAQITHIQPSIDLKGVVIDLANDAMTGRGFRVQFAKGCKPSLEISVSVTLSCGTVARETISFCGDGDARLHTLLEFINKKLDLRQPTPVAMRHAIPELLAEFRSQHQMVDDEVAKWLK